MTSTILDAPSTHVAFLYAKGGYVARLSFLLCNANPGFDTGTVIEGMPVEASHAELRYINKQLNYAVFMVGASVLLAVLIALVGIVTRAYLLFVVAFFIPAGTATFGYFLYWNLFRKAVAAASVRLINATVPFFFVGLSGPQGPNPPAWVSMSTPCLEVRRTQSVSAVLAPPSYVAPVAAPASKPPAYTP